MAKKPLTPEQAEIKAMKKAKKSENWTKFWAILLAAVLTFAVVSMGKTAAEDAIEKAKENQTENVGGNDTTPGGTTTTPGGTTTTPGGTTTPGSTTTPGGTTNPEDPGKDNSKNAEYVKLLNDATAKASKMGYKWERMAAFANPENPLQVLDSKGNDASGSLNTIIALVDKNATISGVVGGFLDIPQDGKPYTATVKKGQTSEVEGMRGKEEKFLLKGATLTAEDLASDVTVSGNTYTFKIANCQNPQKDNKNALHHVTNDFITIGEVTTEVGKALGDFKDRLKINPSTVNYENIVVVAEIDNGTLKSLKIDYKMDVVELNLVADLLITQVPMTGKGAGNISIKYNNFA